MSAPLQNTITRPASDDKMGTTLLDGVGSPRVRKGKRNYDNVQMMVGSKLFTCNDASLGDPISMETDNNCSNAMRVSMIQALRTRTRETIWQQGKELSESSEHQKKLLRVASLPTLSDLSGQESGDDGEGMEYNTPLGQPLKVAIRSTDNRMRESVSVPSLQAMTQAEAPPPSPNSFANTNPDQHYRGILRTAGVSVQTFSALDLTDFFLETADEHIASYGTDIIAAIRQEDIDTLRLMHNQGRSLQCCNRFGESILHMACRRGSYRVVRFLIEEASVSFKLRDDYGRTPLHDACWTREPEIELVKMLVTRCPDLLLVTDKRGFTPFQYVRKDHWGQWCEFLEANQDILTPHILVGRQ